MDTQNQQIHIQAMAAIDDIPVRSQVSSQVTCDQQNDADNTLSSRGKQRALFCPESSTTLTGNLNSTFSYSPVSQAYCETNISPTSSTISAMDEISTYYSQLAIDESAISQRCSRFSEASAIAVDPIEVEDSAKEERRPLQADVASELFSLVWPVCPIGLENAPMINKWETHRVAYHCSVDMKDISLDCNTVWEDQDAFWDALKRHHTFRGKCFPKKCDRGVWIQGQGQDLDATESVAYKASLSFDHGDKVPKIELERPVFEKGCRLRRKFGSHRFIEVGLLFINQGKKIIDEADKKKALARWLVYGQHSFLSQHWLPFFIEDISPSGDKKGNATTHMTAKRVMFFAEQQPGPNLNSSGYGIATQSTVPSTSSASNNTLSRYAIIDWLLQLDSNTDQAYMKLFHRISLGLSKTTPTVLLPENSILHHQTDIQSSEGFIMNDGIGRISHSLLKEVRDIMGLDTLPVAIQGRIGSAKGIWMLDLSSVSSDDQWIETYPSQRKWHCDWSDPAHRTLEVVSYSRELQQATLNHQFIPILEEQAINRGLLQTILCNRIDQQLSQELDQAKAALESPEFFRKWTHRYNHSQSGATQHDSSWFIGGLPQDRREAMSFLVDGGFDPKRLKYLNTKMFELQKDRWQRTKEKLHIKITKSTYALMTMDFQGILAPNEVQLCFSPAFNDGNQTLHDLGGVDVLVSRCPAHLPSDIQKVKAVFRPELRQLKNVVIFSSLGESPLAAKLSGSDYDGDKAWICWDPDVVKNFEGAKVEPAISFEKFSAKHSDNWPSYISIRQTQLCG